MAIIVLSPAEVAEILGRPTRWVIDLARSGELPGRKVGRRWAFLESDVQAYLDACRVADRSGAA